MTLSIICVFPPTHFRGGLVITGRDEVIAQLDEVTETECGTLVKYSIIYGYYLYRLLLYIDGNYLNQFFTNIKSLLHKIEIPFSKEKKDKFLKINN